MVSALYVREDSIYKIMGVDCWDIDRDARNWPGGNAVIAHPPCRAWGLLSQFAKPRPDEKELALHAVKMIRKWGGVLEHPYGSKLWEELIDGCRLPKPGRFDVFGGYTICINQSWYGHKAQKKTFLYIVGCPKAMLPNIPITYDAIEYVVRPSKNGTGAKIITKKEREATPPRLAKWLIDVATTAGLLNEFKAI